jgi:large subunit ribosomal protein L20
MPKMKTHQGAAGRFEVRKNGKLRRRRSGHNHFLQKKSASRKRRLNTETDINPKDNKVLDQAKGYRGTKHTSYKRAKEQVWKSGVYAYEGRKQRKRDFRSLWIQRINAGAREHGLSYSQFVHGLRVAEIDLDRKILADLAATEPEAFAAIVAQAKNALDGKPVERRIEVDRRRAEEAPQARQKPKRSKPEPETSAPVPQQDTEVEASGAAERGAEGRVVVGDVEEAAEEERKVNATEAAGRKAEELGVDLRSVEGTGKDGRITVGDVEKAAKAGAADE